MDHEHEILIAHRARKLLKALTPDQVTPPMRKFAHIVHPLIVPPDSDLFRAQPVTFKTMQTAKDFAKDELQVEFYSAQYFEDRSIVPPDFFMTPDLNRSIMDIATFKYPRRLPLLKDILDRLFAATDAEYLIYTGVDIALQPYFYSTVNRIINQGVDAFIINRRVLPETFQDLDQIPLMYAQLGRPHPGRDCYIFKRQVYPRFSLGDVCVGMRRVGAVLALNLVYYSINFQEFRDLHMTFHLGERSFWRDKRFDDYHAHNLREWTRLLESFRQRYPHVKSEFVDRMARTDSEKRM